MSTLKNMYFNFLGGTVSNLREEQVQDAVREKSRSNEVDQDHLCSRMLCTHGSDYALHPLYSLNHVNSNSFCIVMTLDNIYIEISHELI